MKNDNISIKSILVIPYSPTTCTYYINDGERHACSYDKINELLTSLAPSLVYQFWNKLSRKLPFYIDIKEKELKDVGFDEQEKLIFEQKEKNKLTQNAISEYINALQNGTSKYKPIMQDLKDKIFSKLYKK